MTDPTMRILLAAPRKSGAAQLRCMLASVYSLALVDPRGDAPSDELGGIPEGSILATDRAFTTLLGENAQRQGADLVAIIRHPYDLFVSTYLIAQQRSQRAGVAADRATTASVLEGKPIDDPAVLHFLDTDFAAQIAWLLDWHGSGASIVRFEDLMTSPASTLQILSDRIAPVDRASIDRALLICPAENPVRSRPEIGRRMRVVPPGAWREHLTPAHMTILETRYHDALRALGYADV